ncbi:hypothetical protein M569_09275 [Genlisea aurea]|uniref:Uncharacterized protein n=1 Tax=Genlisea aurea TaxID=192259 RepID=S8CF20_9LAMI|nr:hypothetical protein M569_09275 [Genlisea aurea]
MKAMYRDGAMEEEVEIHKPAVADAAGERSETMNENYVRRIGVPAKIRYQSGNYPLRISPESRVRYRIAKLGRRATANGVI